MGSYLSITGWGYVAWGTSCACWAAILSTSRPCCSRYRISEVNTPVVVVAAAATDDAKVDITSHDRDDTTAAVAAHDNQMSPVTESLSRTTKRNGLFSSLGPIRRLYVIYLILQTFAASCTILNDTAVSDTSRAYAILRYLFHLLLGLAAYVYVLLGRVLYYGAYKLQTNPNKARNTRLALGCFVVFAFALVPGVQYDFDGPLVFAIYLPAATYALFAVFYRVHAYSKEGCPDVHVCGCAPMQTLYTAVLGGILGYIDFLLPAVAVVGAGIWEASFLSRVLDCVLYLPMVLPAMIWFDQQPQFRFNSSRLKEPLIS